MKHLPRPLALSLSMLAAGCADSAPAPAEMPSTVQMEPFSSSEEAEVQLTVDGRGEPMNAQARIDVVEGQRAVALTITGGDDADNVVVIDVAFDGVENVVGEHVVQLGPLESEGPYAAAMFEGQVYDSQSGEVELSVTSDGGISGNFDIQLVQVGAGAAEAATDPVDAMTGVFSGRWRIYCLSPVRGFTGGHAVTDSPYCNSLEL